jgi:hypothetical protein
VPTMRRAEPCSPLTLLPRRPLVLALGRARADMGAVCRLAKDAVDILAGATNLELYGRVLCGLEPDTSHI